MKIFVCQTAPKVGAIEENSKIIQHNYKQSEITNADICVFPELCITGYLAEDLFVKKDFVEKANKYAKAIIEQTKETYLLLPTILLENDLLYNVVIIAQNGKIVETTYKNELPNHGVFDERRYFTPGKSNIININGIKIGIPICEDIWHSSVCTDLKNRGAELFIVPNASPYEKDKMAIRAKLVRKRYEETSIPIIYCNQALAHDGIIFDGRSFIYDSELKTIGKSFDTDAIEVEYKDKKFVSDNSFLNTKNVYEEILDATVLGVRQYVHDNGFRKVIIGLSGGIDSAIVAFIAAKALGNENVLCYMLPSKFTSQESLDDASQLAENLNISLESISIQNIVDEYEKTLSYSKKTNKSSITYQNFQSRTRGTILMGLSNDIGALLLTTGNKSEYATGYATIYGDMNGAFNPIKDLYKTEIFEIAKYINLQSEIIPSNIISKPPSAELAPDQRDTDSLPNYDILDQILYQLIENRSCPETL
ncbi:MAG: NAD+ synthase, partial [Pseudomonadota bacterium]